MSDRNPSVHTVEAVRAYISGDMDEMYVVTRDWLDDAEAEGMDMLEAAGILLRDAYGFASVLARTIAQDDPSNVEFLMDAYVIQAMDSTI